MSGGQSQFTAALLDPARAVPVGLTDPDGRPAGKRFDVYRNNVTVSLVKALETAFPAIAGILGPENFPRVAGVFVRQHPPVSPLMMHYGAEMPGFLEGFAPLAAYPWLGDLARLELALRESYHAADAPPVSAETLQSLPPDRLMSARLALAPSLRLMRSRWPILGLWRQQIQPDAPAPGQAGEAVLITRAEFDPRPQLLPPGGATFLLAAQAGQPFGAALDQAESAVAGFDLAATLGLLIAGGAITKIIED